MPSFTINPLKTGQTPTYYHPSLPNLKQTRPTFTFSETGLATPNKRVSFYIKESQAANAAVASDTVMVNGSHSIKNNTTFFNTIKTPHQDLPSLDQEGGICQTIPFLHMIQSQVDFPIDYELLWDCLPSTPSFGIGPIGETLFFSFYSLNSSYCKLFNLVFSGNNCIPVGEIKCPDTSKSQRPGKDTDKSCEGFCLRKVRIEAIKLPPVSSEQDLCERLNTYGPLSIIAGSLTTKKLTLLNKYPDQYPTWESVKNLTDEQIDTEYPNLESDGGHATTITACVNGKFIIKNSWGQDNANIEISWNDINNYFELYSNTMDLGTKMRNEANLTNYVLKVRECFSGGGSVLCDEEQCKEAGYDGAKPRANVNEGECECECDTIINNNGNSVQRVFNQQEKKCECPPENLSYYDYDENCNEIPVDGHWCLGKWCENSPTSYTFYPNGNHQTGNYATYAELLTYFPTSFDSPYGSFIKGPYNGACDYEQPPCETSTPTVSPAYYIDIPN